MFWQLKKSDKKRKPGLTGTGEFVQNVDCWLWDDLASPGLINIEQFGELREKALSPDQNRRLSMILVQNAIVDSNGRKHLAARDKTFAEDALKKVGNYLREIRENDFEKLDYWLGSNFLLHDDGWVNDQHGRRVNRDILRVLQAYINCLGMWGFGYAWEEICDAQGMPALLINRGGKARFSISRSEVEYIQGKPYRFSILTSRSAWHFDSGDRSFEIRPRGGAIMRF